MSLQTQVAPHTRARFYILSLLTIGTMINYLDRTVLGIAAPSLTKELEFSAATMGIVFSASSWTYAAMQIPGGIFNFAANLAGIITPLMIGFIVALMFIAIVALVGAFSYIFIVGDIRRIELG